MVNTAGGVTGGDRYDLDISVTENASLTLSTQAAERAYRAQPGEVGRIRTNLKVRNGARLDWLPQELILFDHCNLARHLNVELEPNARFLMVEPVAFGRIAMQEKLHNASFRDRINIRRGGRPLYVDGMDLSGNVDAQLTLPAIADGAGAMASVVLVDPRAAGLLNAVRTLLPHSAGASLLDEDLLVIRQLAPDSFELRRTLVPLLELLTQNNLPKSWRL